MYNINRQRLFILISSLVLRLCTYLIKLAEKPQENQIKFVKFAFLTHLPVFFGLIFT